MKKHFPVPFFAVFLCAILASAPSVRAADPEPLTWDPGSSGFDWRAAGNWDGRTGQFPDDSFDQAIFSAKGATADPILDGDLEGSGNGLGQLVFNAAGWTVWNEAGEDNLMNFNSLDYYGYNAIYSSGAGTNIIKPKVALLHAGQNVYTGSGNTLVLEQLTGSHAFVVSSTNPTGIDTGTVKLTGSNTTLTGAFLIRQGTLNVAHTHALGSGSGTVFFGDSYSANGANARLLTDSALTVSKNLEVRSISGHQVHATIGTAATAGISVFSGTLSVGSTTALSAQGSSTVQFSNIVSGAGGITKTGTGTVILSGGSTFAGNAVLDEGTVLVNSTHGGSGTWTVSSNAVLGGTGSIQGSAEVLTGGVLSPGSSIESLSINGNVHLDGSLEIQANGLTGLIDLLDVGGTLAINNGTVNFDVTGMLTAPAYVFAEYDTLNGSAFAVVRDLPTGYMIDYDYMNNHQIALVPIPEPAVILLSVLGMAAVSRRRQAVSDKC